MPAQHRGANKQNHPFRRSIAAEVSRARARSTLANSARTKIRTKTKMARGMDSGDGARLPCSMWTCAGPLAVGIRGWSRLPAQCGEAAQTVTPRGPSRGSSPTRLIR